MKACYLLTGVLLILLVGIVSASSMTLLLEASGNGCLIGSNEASWQITSVNETNGLVNGSLSSRSLCPGQEVVMGGTSESYISLGPSAYRGTFSLDNSDIIHMNVTKDFIGDGYYQNDLYLMGMQRGLGSEISCDGMESPGGTGNVTSDSYNDLALISNRMIGSNLQYTSQGSLNAWANDVPDTLGMNFMMAGNGYGFTDISSFNQNSNGLGPDSLGYQNFISSHTMTGGKPFTMAGSFQYTSFKLTFPPVDNSTQGV